MLGLAPALCGLPRTANRGRAKQDPSVGFQLLWDQSKAKEGNNFAEVYFGAFRLCFWLVRWQCETFWSVSAA